MEENINQTSNAFMEVTTRKVDMQDKKIAAVEKKIEIILENTEQIPGLKSTVEVLRNDINNIRFPEEKLQKFSAVLELTIEALKNPAENKVLHQHHLPKIIWITSGLFVAFALVCSGWYATNNKLDTYNANDTKYRQLRLDTANRSLQSYLDMTDSLYNTNPHLRQLVIQAEEQNRKNFESLQKAERLRKEAKELETSVKKK